MSSIVSPGKFLALIFFWSSLFVNSRQHSSTNYESGISTPFLKIFIRIRWYMRFFYLFKFLLLFLTKFNKLLLDRNYWSIFYIPMLLRLTQCNIFIRIIFDCSNISILHLKTSFFSCYIDLDRLSIRNFVKIITRLAWVSVHVIYDV